MYQGHNWRISPISTNSWFSARWNHQSNRESLGIVSDVIFPLSRASSLAQSLTVCALVGAVTASGIALATPAHAVSVPPVSATVEVMDEVYELDPGPLPQYSEPSLTTRKTRSKAAGQCQYGSFGSLATDAVDAANIMRGQARVTSFGTFKLKKNPSWRYTSSLDRSGNGLMHALHWALPLLRHGTRVGNKAMVNRFYNLVHDWIKDNPPSRPRQSAAYEQIASGFRMVSLSCALAGPATKRKLIVKALQTQAKTAVKRWGNVNNVSFLQAGGIYAAGCAVGNKKLRNQGLKRMKWNSAKMIATDGSVREGSMNYSLNTYLWTQQQIARIRNCGGKVPTVLNRSNLIPAFLAYSVRPDSRYEALGDGVPKKAKATDAPAGSSLRYMATAGAEGTAPATNYAAFESGYIFGHSGYGQSQPFKQETFYSLRTGPGHSTEYHAHNDAASLTVAADGDQLLHDTGQYRYSNDPAQWFVYSRAAHNVVSLDGRSSNAPRPSVVTSTTSEEGDLTSIVDPAYAGTRLQRTVWYDRRGDYFIVMDDVVMDRAGTFYLNWNLGRDRTATVDEQSVVSSGSGANVSLINVGNPVTYSVVAGATSPYRGWNSSKYGELVPSPSVRAHAAGPVNRIVTVVVPRGSGVAPTEASATGTVTIDGADVTTTKGGQTYRVALTSTGAVRLPEEPELP